MEFIDVINSRRSTRAFTDRKVSRAEIDAMLGAAIKAPSACNMQSWHFYAVTDPSVRERLGAQKAFSSWAAEAPVVFIICTDGEAIVNRFGERAEKLFILQDTAAATENLLLCAADLGLGGCWMGMFNEDVCREIIGISDKHRVVAVVPVGEPANEVPPRERKPLSEVVTYVGCDCGDTENESGTKSETPFKLVGASLPNAEFNDLNLEGATFDNINLHGATFNNINLSGARFTDINMSGTSYGGLTLQGAHFGCVELDDAVFENPSFTNASFKNCSFKGAKFSDCDLDGVTFDGDNNLNMTVKKDGGDIIIK